MRAWIDLVALAALAGCAMALPPGAVLPNDALVGAGDPTRAAILGTAYAFGTPESLAGQPASAARAAAGVEYLAAEIPNGPRWIQFDPTLGRELLAARAELREALGISPAASPQAVVDGLYAASRALKAADPTAAAGVLRAPAFADASVTLVRLGQMPATPRTQLATALAQQELNRIDQEGRFSGGGNGADRP